MPQTSVSFPVQEITHVAPGVNLYRFDFGATPFEFFAGQFCVVTLPGSTPPITAPLSLASSPMSRESFELVVKRTGNFGTRMYDEVVKGQLVEMKPPAGKFTLSASNPAPVSMIAFDYCVSGVRSIWQHHEDSADPRRFNLIHITRGTISPVFGKEFEETSVPPRAYIPVSRPVGTSGFGAHEAAALIPDILTHQVYIVGEGDDVFPAVQSFKEAGLPEDSLHFERWS